DRGDRVGRGGSGDRGGGVQGGDEVERGRPVGEGAVDVAREVPQIGQLEGEGHVARGDGAVFAERRDDAVHGELVLVLVLGRGGESNGCLHVTRGVSTPGCAAGEHPRGDRSVVNGDEGFGAGAEE